MAESSTPKGEVRRILVADDSECVRSILRKSLETQPSLQVCGEAVDGTDAIEQGQKLKPDLVMLDLAMPGLNGIETASILRKRLPDVPIVLFTIHETASGDAVGSAAAMAVGVTATISKHEGLAAVLKCVRELLGME